MVGETPVGESKSSLVGGNEYQIYRITKTLILMVKNTNEAKQNFDKCKGHACSLMLNNEDR